jgi:hypothetical protein
LADIAYVIETARSDPSLIVTVCGIDENIETDGSNSHDGTRVMMFWLAPAVDREGELHHDRPDSGAPGG